MSRAKRPERAELLLPAGDLRRLKTAVLYGADAIYAGTPDLSLRTKSEFSLEDLQEGARFAHERGKRLYLTLNLFTHNKDIEKLPGFLETIRKIGPDGVIVADPGVFQFLKDNAPELERHISTQANLCSWLSVDYWQKQGADLAVLAREVTFEELSEIREKCPDIKLETFVHGAMCMTYSGRCLLSNFMAERGANQGNCAHSCRWNYKVNARLKDGTETVLNLTDQNKDLFEFFLEEEFRPGEMFPIEEDEHGSYIMNSKDLCLLPVLPDLLRVGVDSLKIEGRNKSEYYAAITARAYRQAIDDWYENPSSWAPEDYLRELHTLQNRGYTLGFHEGRLTNLAHNYNRTESLGSWQFAGCVREWDGDDLIFEVRNALETGDVIEFLPPGSVEVVRLRLYEYEDGETGQVTQRVSAGQGKAIRIPLSAFHAEDGAELKAAMPPLTIGRKAKPLGDAEQASVDAMIAAQDLERGVRDVGGNVTSPSKSVAGKAPKLGLDGCCGLGCNGCAMFWHDDKYAKARDMLKEKGMGRRLAK